MVHVHIIGRSNKLHVLLLKQGQYCTCADLEGGSGGGSGPPLEFAKLNITELLEMKKLVIFHICALPQLYITV